MNADTPERYVTERVNFDGDWKKAAAIDMALCHAMAAVHAEQSRIRAAVTGRTPLDARTFESIPTIFEAVLKQLGYEISWVFVAEDES